MPTVNQLIRVGRKAIKAKSKSSALNRCPQRRGVCLRVYTTTPKKTKFSPSEGGKGSPHDRVGGNGLYSWYGA